MKTKKNEAVHLEMVGELMKEVVDRQFRGRSSGISFRIAPGVRYRTGAFRGHCRAMHLLIRTFNQQRHKEETFQPVWDKHVAD